MGKGKIRVAICGVGNCASALIQGIEYYRHNPDRSPGLMHKNLGGYFRSISRWWPPLILIAVRWAVLSKSRFRPPNCVFPIWTALPHYGVTVQMGPVLDGVAPHMKDFPPDRTFLPAEQKPVDVEQVLKKTKAEILGQLSAGGFR